MKTLLFTTLFSLGILTALPDPKTLILIIASDDKPVYHAFVNVWKQYMHSDKDHFDAYFLRGDPTLRSPLHIEGDTIWARCEEGLPPYSSSILTKTVLALDAFKDKLNSYDFVLRTNLSSFYIFPRLLTFLKTLPRKKCYSGARIINEIKVLSGSGFILSTDLVREILKKKESFLGVASDFDDMILGRFILSKKVRWIPHERTDFLQKETIKETLKSIPEHVFQIRTKHPESERLKYDVLVHNALLNIFYKD